MLVGTSAGPFNLYSRHYSAGTVELGGNRASGGTGLMNYFVAVVQD
jgi:hypothetical protein